MNFISYIIRGSFLYTDWFLIYVKYTLPVLYLQEERGLTKNFARPLLRFCIICDHLDSYDGNTKEQERYEAIGYI